MHESSCKTISVAKLYIVTMASSSDAFSVTSLSEGSALRKSLNSSVQIESGKRDYHTMSANEPSEMLSSQVADLKEGEGEDTRRRKRCTCYHQEGTISEHVVYFCALAVASYVGVVVRIYVSHFSQWNGVPLFPSYTAELVGSAIMGFIAAHSRLLANDHKIVYRAIATGLCGSITTFSSWNSEAAETLLQIGKETPNNVTRIIGWLSTIVLGVGMPLAALHFGSHLAHFSPLSNIKLQRKGVQENNASAQKFWFKLESVVFVVAWILLTCLVVAVPYHFSHFELMFSVILAPLGTYIRWHLAPLNSTCTNYFKLGTFFANIGGSWILAGTLVAKANLSGQLGAHHLGVKALAGVATGFCGCLTTVSTFAEELSSLPLLGSYVYAITSILAAQLGMVIIRGTYEWTGN